MATAAKYVTKAEIIATSQRIGQVLSKHKSTSSVINSGHFLSHHRTTDLRRFSTTSNNRPSNLIADRKSNNRSSLFSTMTPSDYPMILSERPAICNLVVRVYSLSSVISCHIQFVPLKRRYTNLTISLTHLLAHSLFSFTIYGGSHQVNVNSHQHSNQFHS